MLDDLAGPASIALLEMAAAYEPARGVPFRGYAFPRIHGACVDAIKRREYRERGHLSIDGLALAGMQFSTTDPSPERQAIAAQMWEKAMRLSPRHALVIRAVYADGMTLTKLAAKLGVSPSRLSQMHHEALRMLAAA